MTPKPTETVLVIDPDAPRRDDVGRALATAGLQPLLSDNGDDGERLARFEIPDAIVLGLGGNGACADACRRLGSHPETDGIPILLMSGRNDLDGRRRALAAGADDFLVAPWTTDELLDRLSLLARAADRNRRADEVGNHRVGQLRRAQSSLLPAPDALPEACFGVEYIPALEAGGDYYDVFEVAAGVFCYFVADVAGHDLGASYATAALKALLRTAVDDQRPLDRALNDINRGLLPLMTDGRHLTACLTRLDRARGHLEVASAGHPSPVVLPGGGAPRPVGGSGDVLGVFSQVVIPVEQVELAPGDRFFLYSDGLVEATRGPEADRASGIGQLGAEALRTRHFPIRVAVAEMVVQMMSDPNRTRDDLVLLGVQL